MIHRIAPTLLLLFSSLTVAGEARYTVRLSETAPPRFLVEAVLPGGSALRMDETRPGDLPALLEHGWPALVSGLRVVDGGGRVVAAESTGATGWRLPAGTTGPLTVTYEVGTAALAAAGWPAPREAAHVEEGTIVVVGRALFITRAPDQRSAVSFKLPPGWRAVLPWPANGAATADRLTQNMLVLTRKAPEVVRAGGFSVSLVPLGPWAALRAEVRRAVRAPIERFVRFLPVEGQESYVAVLLPMQDRGAESFRQSLALTFPEPPSTANRRDWANLLAHEIFHYWNGWAMQPADYGRSQWFQEGFTEYAANMALLGTGGMSPAQFRECLATHVENARRLTTSLEETGGRKGPPLYSAGALVAFAWDVRIREETAGARDLRDFMGSLWRRTGRGKRAWEKADLVAALQETAPGPWEAFLEAHVKGTTPVPYAEVLGRAGLRLLEAPVRVEEDPAASASAKKLLAQLAR